jgi:hypothetical protein
VAASFSKDEKHQNTLLNKKNNATKNAIKFHIL